jgi:hypothetical protein
MEMKGGLPHDRDKPPRSPQQRTGEPIMTDRLVRHNGIPEHKRWCTCLDCRTAREDDQEAEYALRLLDAQDTAVRRAKPATDAEWAAFMNLKFPRVKEGVSRG